MAEPPAQRASDEERERTLEALREAAVDGRLTVEELAERAELAQVARTRDALAAVTADLAPPLAAAAAPERQLALLSSLRREGRFRLAERNRFVAVLGSVTLDLRQAVLPGPEVEIEVKHVLGSARLIVPEHADVEVVGGAVLSGRTVRLGDETPPPGAPRLRIRVRGALGSFDVRTRPPLGEQLAAAARRLAERLADPYR